MFDKSAAERIVSQLDLEASNRELAQYWLSLWRGGELPSRSAFNPVKMRAFLTNILMFNVIPDVSITVRLAGTGYRHILGRELTGEDWIAAAPEAHKAVRLHLFSALARGAVLVAHRHIEMTVGEDYISEEILLPFARESSGAYPVLVHVNWKPNQFLKIKSVREVIGDPLDYKLVPLPEITSAELAIAV